MPGNMGPTGNFQLNLMYQSAGQAKVLILYLFSSYLHMGKTKSPHIQQCSSPFNKPII